MNSKLILKTIFLLSVIIKLEAQGIQTIRGRVVDQDAEGILIGATIRVLNSDLLLGTITDVNGEFRIDNVPLGRNTLVITYIGYEDKIIPNLLVTAAKEVILNIGLQESIENLEAVVVTAKQNPAEVLNEMALISARSFSVEETQRYSGALNDPARMVANFAGVASNAEGNNDIVVRGNSPRGILWRLEGMEIPNPNHFANEGATGGPINALNSNMLSDSDFMTGAFSPEYGNALSGVFDMKFKKGNNEQKEYTASASLLGLDFAAEGPFKKGRRGSYIANYRYSSLQLLSDIGIFDFGGVPKYQDLSYNISVPINKKHHISSFGLGGISSIAVDDEEDDGTPTFRGEQKAYLGISGISHTFFINDKSFMRNTITTSVDGTLENGNLPDGEGNFFETGNIDIDRATFRWSGMYNHKINAKHKIEAGIIVSHKRYKTAARELNFEMNVMETVLEDDGNANIIQGFTSWKYRMNESLTLISGLHYLHFTLNGSNAFEPRTGLRWDLNKRQALTFGVGVHSKVESISTYLAKQTREDGTTFIPNRSLKPTKATHYVIGYQHMLNPNTQLKVEAYYQHLFDVPIEDVPGSTFSLLNETEGFVNETLVKEGTGRNYGLEFTLERYFAKGFYYLTTLSLYQSQYTAQDGVERSTAFNGNYVANFLAGKEFRMGKPEKNKVVFFNTKMALIGGSRYTPIDLEASRELGSEVRQDNRPFSSRGDDIFTLNIAIGTRRNKNRTTREFKIDVSNVTNNQGIVNEYYLEATERIERSPQLTFFPNLIYSIKF
ncbi:MAG: TonB-dependent receptor [Cyclobacteriaceae bacterium]|nr:TonB-dependent receptor [Cyclobacteriaceae bacterium HetDA_MAG_MS6]